MDKTNKIINELNDMANFKGFGESEEEILNADGSRNWQANILLDNVKRLEQENARLKSCLQEIKAIVCGDYEIIDPQGRKDILKLITKAEEE